MGPLFVILFWAIIGSVVGLLASVVLVAIIRRVTCHVTAGRKRALTIAGVLPFIGLGYLFVCVLMFSIWSSARGRDWGWGDTWDIPILGTYHLMMIDVTDRGTVYDSSDPRVANGGSVSGSPADQDVLFGVRRLEIRPPFIIGTAAPAADTGFEENPPETVFFRMDTRDRTRIDKKTLAELEKITGRTTLKPVDNIYGSLRYNMIDLIPFVLFAIPPIVATWYLLRALSRLRAIAHTA